MKKIICSTSTYSIGCTFLDWSINFLSGQTTHFNKNKGILSLSQNPLTENNAHGHLKNHPSGLKQTQEFVEFLESHTDFVTAYPHPLELNVAAEILGKNILKIKPEQFNQINEFVIQDYQDLLYWLSTKNAKIIFVSLDPFLSMYANTSLRNFQKSPFGPGPIESEEHLREIKDLIFFQESVDEWKNLNLNDVWDIRERLALSTRPLEIIHHNIDFSFDHYWIDSRDLWFNGVNKIQEIMSWLELPVDASRVESWKIVYMQWQNIQAKKLEFQNTYSHIVDAIVNGWSYPIDLTFEQEVVIQHCLIYQHNLNLKTWQLEKFPNNTLELYKLLEPNIHPLSNTY